MWLLTGGADPRCRGFLNVETLTGIGHLSGQAFLDAIQPEFITGIAPDATVLFGQEAGSGKLRFLLTFKDNDHSDKLSAVQAAVGEALRANAGFLNLEELGQTLLPE